MKHKNTFLFVLLVIFSNTIFAQKKISGIVKSTKNEPLAGVNISIEGTSLGTVTDVDGKYTLESPNDQATLVFSFIGYITQKVKIGDQATIDVIMSEDALQLEAILVVGSRFQARSEANSPVAIDRISAQELADAGHNEVDQMITYKAPSYNASNQTVSDATAHMNPADLRGLSPSRTLVLVNGKRKNPSALVYINDTPGKGEVGVDMKSIPTSAIERIEVLRDGASAQYGSDAIAGVINIVLKKNVEYAEVSTSAGITTKGDGGRIGINANYGFSLGERGGFMNVSTGYSYQNSTNRPGNTTQDPLFGVMKPGDNGYDWVQKNPDLGMTVGQPEMQKGDVFFNTEIPLSDNAQFYAFGGLTNRKGKSFALYRTPYWFPKSIYGNEGFQPTFETDILDKTLSLGLRGTRSGWNFDLSSTYGSNKIQYNVGNTLNADMGNLSPSNFYAGGYIFQHTVNNLDISRSFGKVNVAFGAEFRTENFIAMAGEPNSYEYIDPKTGNRLTGGAQSFPGIRPSNEVDKHRYNIGFYTELESDITEDLLVGIAARYENYSDFGNTLNWKINARHQFMDDKLNIRASVSTGFRAPALHQIYLSNIQTIVAAGSVSDQGTFNNHSPILRTFNVPRLTQEKALNMGAGITFQPNEKLLFTVDYYNIKVDDRIVFTGAISNSDPTTRIGAILSDYNIKSFKFFTNAINTQTNGVDIVATYNNLELGSGRLNVSLAANFNKTEIVGDLKTPDLLANEGNALFDRKERSRIESARPKDKIILGLNYKIGKFTAVLNNTRFGEVTWRHGSKPENDQTFGAKIVTDLTFNFDINEKFRVSLGSNNLLDVYPDEIDAKNDPTTNLGGRFRYPWEVNQFGFNGRYVFGKLTIKL